MKFPEDDLQMKCAKYLDSIGVIWCHVANERKTTKWQGLRLKKKGVKSGVPDILIFNKNSNYNGCAIELKIKPNKPSDNQKKWLRNLVECGWCSYVAYSSSDVYDIVSKYMK